jgi:hypothetical protein
MRSMLAHALTLWQIGDRKPAIDELWEMLRINPNDNQGVRYILLSWLLAAGSLAELDLLRSRYKDDPTARWNFDIALHLFRSGGDNAASRKQLRAAFQSNAHIAPLLLRDNPYEGGDLPEFVSVGSEGEAQDYVLNSLIYWVETQGAIEWVEQESKSSQPRKKSQQNQHGVSQIRLL